ncbi:HAMP domain-containing histidine kinase [Shewanella gelidimarina]|uniref:sensor histidine kinase n=1 Tax=Shewanella gelidimarina TaxID=56813 RepID=UPI00200F8A83|nr:HAMP domain-containing sensor histidine kinase [Shewanella gelidimarina]MCL1057280.1 HAMP domain-containing histidine kinase [Shewanella gelidimarina]
MPIFVTFNIYLFYGLVFFSIGCAVVFRNFRYSQLKVAPTLWALAIFGFSHAFHEWSELYVIIFSDNMDPQYQLLTEWLRLAKLFLSYLALMVFAWQILSITTKRIALVGHGIILAILACYFWLVIPNVHDLDINRMGLIEASQYTRVLIGFGSASLAGVGMAVYGNSLRQEQHHYGLYFVISGVGLLIYGVLSGLVATDYHHSVPVLRTLAGGLILVALFKALKVFDLEKEQATAAKLKRALEADKYKAIGRLAMGVAHEINNPLASSTLALDLWQRKNPQHFAFEDDYLNRARLGIERASSISKELLNYARPASGKRSDFAIADILNSAVKLLAHRCKQNVIELNCGAYIHLYGEKVKLEELIINLLCNAIDASQSGQKIVVDVSEGDTTVTIMVTDFGCGMDREALARATELFYSSKPVGKGTGLGLAICEQITSLHHGKMNIVSELGKGTTVELVFYREHK